MRPQMMNVIDRRHLPSPARLSGPTGPMRLASDRIPCSSLRPDETAEDFIQLPARLAARQAAEGAGLHLLGGAQHRGPRDPREGAAHADPSHAELREVADAQVGP